METHDKIRPADSRRQFLKHAGALATYGALGGGAMEALAATADKAAKAGKAAQAGSKITLPFANGERELAVFPQKRPLILLTNRPPQLETPFSVFNESLITPNDAFFVRYHWSEIPTSVDPKTYRLKIGGKVNKPLELSLADLKRLATPVDLVAVNQCSGNSRGFSSPRVNGGQLGNGAMGNARWTGVPLRAVLEKAGVQAGAKQVTFNGLDHPPLENSPDFVKALDIDHAMDGEVMLAWGMNGADLPMLNGYPLRLVVPGRYGTYWVKHLSDIQVIDKTFDGFWMASAYRVPANDCACVEPGATPGMTVPIGRFAVRSFITSLQDGASVHAGRDTLVNGIAFDGGYGITEVAFSADDGRTWQPAKLGKDMGRYAFRPWTAVLRKPAAGELKLRVRATNGAGQTQPMEARWNPPGYMRNVVETTRVVAA